MVRSMMSQPSAQPAALISSLLLGWATIGCAGDPSVETRDGFEATTAGGQSVVTEAADPEAIRLTRVGTELARAGRCAQAIAEAFTPALAIFERQYQSSGHPPRASRVLNPESVTALDAEIDDPAEGSPSEAPRLGPEWSDAMYLQAFCLVDTGRSEEAAVLLARALTLIPNDVVYACELGHIRQQQRRFEDAIELFRGALENAEFLGRAGGMAGALLFGQPLDWWTRRSLRGIGFSLFELGRLEEAEATYRRVLELDPRDQQAIRELQLIATRRGAI